MSVVRNIARKTTLLIVGEIISKALLFFIGIAAARMLGTAGFGHYSFALALPLLFYAFTDMGLAVLAAREIARNREELPSLFWNVCLVKFIFSFLVLAVIIGVMSYSHYPLEIVYAVVLASIYCILDSYSWFFRNILVTVDLAGIESVSMVIEKLIISGMGIVFLLQGKSFLYLLIAYVVAGLVRALINSSTILWFFHPPVAFSKAIMWSMLHKGFPLFLFYFFGLFYVKIDVTLLSYLRGDADVGIYSAASTIVALFAILPSVYALVILPIFSQHESAEKAKKAYMLSTKFLLATGIILAAMVIVLSKTILSVVYGAAYAMAALVLSVLGIKLFFQYLTYLTSLALIAMNKEYKLIRGLVMVGILTLVLDWFLIASTGMLGAAMVAGLVELLFYFYSARMLANDGYPHHFFPLLKIPLLASIATALLIYLLQSHVPLIILIPLAIMFYSCGIFFSKYFNSEIPFFKELAIHRFFR